MDENQLHTFEENLVFAESGLICYDVQKFHKEDVGFSIFSKEASDRDIFHLLTGVLAVNS